MSISEVDTFEPLYAVVSRRILWFSIALMLLLLLVVSIRAVRKASQQRSTTLWLLWLSAVVLVLGLIAGGGLFRYYVIEMRPDILQAAARNSESAFLVAAFKKELYQMLVACLAPVVIGSVSLLWHRRRLETSTP